jgi:anti-sigma regulatory factor (Ser/Thr protein kinase)
MKQTRRFEHTPESVTTARRFADDALQDAPADARDSALLMVSELASNCIRHTDSGFELSVSYSPQEIRVEATDRGGGAPRMRHPGPTDPDGRGLQIIDMLSESWGVDQLSGHGKTVWFTLTLPAEARAGGSAREQGIASSR